MKETYRQEVSETVRNLTASAFFFFFFWFVLCPSPQKRNERPLYINVHLPPQKIIGYIMNNRGENEQIVERMDALNDPSFRWLSNYFMFWGRIYFLG